MSDFSSNDLEREYGAMFEKLLQYITKIYVREFLSEYEEVVKENESWFSGEFSQRLKKIRERVKANVNFKRTAAAMKSVFEAADKKILKILRAQAAKRKVILPEIAYRPSENLKLAIKENVSLISSIAESHQNLIEKAVYRAVKGGADYTQIVDEIKEQTGKSISYARFVAADQLAKTYAAVNAERQSRAGVPGYIWIAKNDQKTRESHRRAAGNYFEWTKESPDDLRPRDKNGKILHPGQDYRCRCIALPSWGD